MNEDHNRYDPYGLSDIEKIQEEIERDLKKTWEESKVQTEAQAPIASELPTTPPVASPEAVTTASTPSIIYASDSNLTPSEASASTAWATPTEAPEASPAIAVNITASATPEAIETLTSPIPPITSETSGSSETAKEAWLASTDKGSSSSYVMAPSEAAPLSAVDNSAFYQETIKESSEATGRKRMSWRRKVAVACIVCTLGTGTLGMGIGAGIPLMNHYLAGGIGSANQGDNAKESANYGVESTSYVFSNDSVTTARDGTLADVIKLVEPSVVSVSSLFENNTMFSMQQRSGDGSGIIFSEDNQKIYIATNYHVVNGATAVNVSIAESEPLSAKLVGRDAEADLAVLSVEKRLLKEAGITNIVIAVFGDSDKLEVGDSVLAIGNAMGEGNSATYGIISAKEKTIPIQNRNLTVLQTDAAINFGNSGGPLVNTKGEVIGINTAKLSDNSYAVEGMGYSISSNIVKPILEELMRTGPRPFLGIEGTTVTEEMAEQFNIPPMGVFVSSVLEGTSAEKAGIVRTDIITSFNGNAMFTMNQLADEVKKCKVGDTVEVKILREGKTLMSLQVKLGEQSGDNF